MRERQSLTPGNRAASRSIPFPNPGSSRESNGLRSLEAVARRIQRGSPVCGGALPSIPLAHAEAGAA
jgi:hypothetical protein